LGENNSFDANVQYLAIVQNTIKKRQKKKKRINHRLQSGSVFFELIFFLPTIEIEIEMECTCMFFLLFFFQFEKKQQ